MRTFLALLVAPSLALACQSLLFALVSPSCSVQTRVQLHVVAAAFLVATLFLSLLARQEWRLRARGTIDARTSGSMETRRMLAAAGTAVAALSSLVIVVMWVAAWVLSPCYQ